jgi:hypothetical protein
LKVSWLLVEAMRACCFTHAALYITTLLMRMARLLGPGARRLMCTAPPSTLSAVKRA